MKFLIKESQFEKVVFRYLDSMDLELIKGLITYEFHGTPVMSDTMRDYLASRIIVVFKVDMDCYVKSDFTQDICDIFYLTPEEGLNVIGRWVESKLGITLNSVYSYFGAD
jgi:hypothetical protein